jgi:hypothetical protein
MASFTCETCTGSFASRPIPLGRCDSGQLDQFLARGVDARIVLQSAGKTECASCELRLEQCLHALEFGCRCVTLEVLAHHTRADGAVPDVRTDIDWRAAAGQGGKEISEWER